MWNTHTFRLLMFLISFLFLQVWGMSQAPVVCWCVNRLSLCGREGQQGSGRRKAGLRWFPRQLISAKRSIFIQWKNKTRIKEGDMCWFGSPPSLLGFFLFLRGSKESVLFLYLFWSSIKVPTLNLMLSDFLMDSEHRVLTSPIPIFPSLSFPAPGVPTAGEFCQSSVWATYCCGHVCALLKQHMLHARPSNHTPVKMPTSMLGCFSQRCIYQLTDVSTTRVCKTPLALS